MRIIHNISLSANEHKRGEFLKAGVALSHGFSTFKIDEADPRWNDIKALSAKYRACDIAATKFTASELDDAEFLSVEPTWHHGYPMPDDDRGFLSATFDLTNYCENCGIGKKQAAPFRVKKLPVWGNKGILQLNWIFDEYFVKPEVWSDIFNHFGVENRPVVLHKTEEVASSVVQLDNQELANLNLDGFPYEQCSYCARTKYLPVTRGFFPRPVKATTHLFRSREYFGSGANAFQMVVISNLLYKKIRDGGVRGADFKPCTTWQSSE
jgi:hypothetical protein